MDEYRVRLDIFEGPFDLLLYLIRVNEMDIYEARIPRLVRKNKYINKKQNCGFIHLMQRLHQRQPGKG